MTLIVDQWYVDATPGDPLYPGEPLIPFAFFKVLGLAQHTVRVVDLGGDDRVVNRLLFESQMQPATRVPMLPRSGA